MPWLVVLGHATWRYGGGAESRGVVYEAGKHEVAQEVADAALASGLRALRVFADEPVLVDADQYEGPVEPRLRERTPYKETGIQLPAVEAVQPSASEDDTALAEYRCPFCPPDAVGYPSRPALIRHHEFNHAV